MTETITILGSTGSIGCNTIKVLENSDNNYRVEALTANSNVELLARQAKFLNVKKAVIADESLYKELKTLLSSSGVEVCAGKNAIIEAAESGSDIVMSSIVGAAGLLPTMAAIKQGSKIALANKECLVCAGQLMMDSVKEYGANMVPVDSEHSAIFQVFDFKQPESLEKITLTASGGPFRTMAKGDMAKVTPEQAVNHPNWSMGNKISIDSATMMNKGLEIIEAYYLFPINKDQIDVIVHPESIIHSMVEYKDGSVLAQLGTPDMCTPIAVALAWPSRISLPTEKLNLAQIGQLNFEAADEDKFPALRLAKQALAEGGAMPAILNTANEVAVAAFLDGKIGFMDISKTVEKTICGLPLSAPKNINDVIAIIDEAREFALRIY